MAKHEQILVVSARGSCSFYKSNCRVLSLVAFTDWRGTALRERPIGAGRTSSVIARSLCKIGERCVYRGMAPYGSIVISLS
jgi:hypothetical protein